MPKSFCSNAGLPGSFTKALSYDEQIQFLIDKYNKMADVINNLKIDADISDVVKYIPQTGFSELQKQQARNNIGAGTSNITSGDISTQIDNNSVKFSGAQNLTEDQKAQARANIGAGTGSGNAENAVLYTAQELTEGQKTQARNNIGAGTSNITSSDISTQINNNSVKFSGAQNLTEDQKAQARANIGAGTGSGSGSAENAVLYTAQELTDGQKTQARNNIGTDAGVYIGSSAPTASDTNLWINPDNTISGYTLPKPNLLDNSNFLDPVNQRGASSGTVDAWSYFIDRWLATDASMTYTLNSDGIQLTAGNAWIAQNVDFKKMRNDTTYTFAIGFIDGTISQCTGAIPSATTSWTVFASNNDDNCYIRMAKTENAISCSFKPKKAVTVKWAGVYEGAYNANTLPPYVSKGYAAELMECQRYFVLVSRNNAMLSGNTGDASGQGARIFLPLGTKMRTNPTASAFIVNASYYGGSKNNLTFTPTSIETTYTGICFYGNLSNTVSASPTYVDAIYQICNNDLAISADL